MSRNRPVRLVVVRTEQVAPSMRRIVFGGDGFDAFEAAHRGMREPYTDAYGKLVFLADGHDYPEPLDLDVVKETMPQEAWPVLRTYTVSDVDEQERLVTIDFVVHGDEGVAGPWAAAAQPGDTMHLRGPNGGYAPDPAADWHLLVGDESALPAIAASIAALDDEATAVAFVEVDGPADERDLGGPAGLELHWLHRGEAAPGTTTLLDDAVRAMPWREGRVQAFVHGESALLKSVRAYLLRERRVARADVSVSAYWRRGTTEEGFRVWKSQQTDAVMRPSS